MQGVTRHKVLAQGLRCPLAKWHAAPRLGAIADGYDDVEVVVFNFTLYLALFFLAHYLEFPDSCFAGQFIFVVDVADVFVDGAYVFVKQLCHLRLGQPDGFLLKGMWSSSEVRGG